MRIVVAGQRSFGAAVVAALGNRVVGVAAPAGDRLRATLPALRREFLPADVDLIVCAHSHDFVGAPTRRAARLGAIGYHPSLLPRHRGRDAVEWTVRMRDAVAGGSVYWLTDRVDGGPIAASEHVLVRPDESASDLWRRSLFPLGVRLIVSVVRDLEAGRMVMLPQDEACATWEPSIGRPPLFRPEVPLLGAGPAGMTVVTRRDLESANGPF